MAENMMELIDGYCRLENDTEESVIFRSNKKGAYDPETAIVMEGVRDRWRSVIIVYFHSRYFFT